MDQGRKRLKTKQSLGEQDISDLFTDELCDVPSDIFSDSGDDRKKKFGAQKVKVNVKLKATPMKVVIVTIRGQPHG
jgi:hypothetical protein